MGEKDFSRRQFIKTVGVASVAAATLSMPFIRASASDPRFQGKTLRLLTLVALASITSIGWGEPTEDEPSGSIRGPS